MTSVWKRLQRVGKKASKFQFVASYQELALEFTKKWQPDKLRVVWTRRNRRMCSKLHSWQPEIKNPYRGMVVWPVPENIDIAVTLFKEVNADEFEDKEWTFVIEGETKGHRKVLASADINLKRFASPTPTQTDLTLKLKPLSVKVVEATLKLSLSCVFVREGKATDEDMQSLASLMSVKPTDIGNLDDFNESDEEEDKKSVTASVPVSHQRRPPEVQTADDLTSISGRSHIFRPQIVKSIARPSSPSPFSADAPPLASTPPVPRSHPSISESGSTFPLTQADKETTPSPLSRGKDSPQNNQAVSNIRISNQPIRPAQDSKAAITENKAEPARISPAQSRSELIIAPPPPWPFSCSESSTPQQPSTTVVAAFITPKQPNVQGCDDLKKPANETRSIISNFEAEKPPLAQPEPELDFDDIIFESFNQRQESGGLFLEEDDSKRDTIKRCPPGLEQKTNEKASGEKLTEELVGAATEKEVMMKAEQEKQREKEILIKQEEERRREEEEQKVMVLKQEERRKHEEEKKRLLEEEKKRLLHEEEEVKKEKERRKREEERLLKEKRDKQEKLREEAEKRKQDEEERRKREQQRRLLEVEEEKEKLRREEEKRLEREKFLRKMKEEEEKRMEEKRVFEEQRRKREEEKKRLLEEKERRELQEKHLKEEKEKEQQKMKEEERRKRVEEEERKRLQEEEERKKNEAESERKRREEEDRRKEEARKEKEIEEEKKRREEEEKRVKEAEKRRKREEEEEEKERVLKEEKEREEKERERLLKEEKERMERRKKEEEKRREEEEEEKRKESLLKEQKEKEKMKQEEEEKERRLQEERRQEAEREKKEEERKKREEEEKRKREEEEKAERRMKEEENRKKREEEQKKKKLLQEKEEMERRKKKEEEEEKRREEHRAAAGCNLEANKSDEDKQKMRSLGSCTHTDVPPPSITHTPPPSFTYTPSAFKGDAQTPLPVPHLPPPDKTSPEQPPSQILSQSQDREATLQSVNKPSSASISTSEREDAAELEHQPITAKDSDTHHIVPPPAQPGAPPVKEEPKEPEGPRVEPATSPKPPSEHAALALEPLLPSKPEPELRTEQVLQPSGKPQQEGADEEKPAGVEAGGQESFVNKEPVCEAENQLWATVEETTVETEAEGGMESSESTEEKDEKQEEGGVIGGYETVASILTAGPSDAAHKHHSAEQPCLPMSNEDQPCLHEVDPEILCSPEPDPLIPISPPTAFSDTTENQKLSEHTDVTQKPECFPSHRLSLVASLRQAASEQEKERERERERMEKERIENMKREEREREEREEEERRERERVEKEKEERQRLEKEREEMERRTRERMERQKHEERKRLEKEREELENKQREEREKAEKERKQHTERINVEEKKENEESERKMEREKRKGDEDKVRQRGEDSKGKKQEAVSATSLQNKEKVMNNQSNDCPPLREAELDDIAYDEKLQRDEEQSERESDPKSVKTMDPKAEVKLVSARPADSVPAVRPTNRLDSRSVKPEDSVIPVMKAPDNPALRSVKKGKSNANSGAIPVWLREEEDEEVEYERGQEDLGSIWLAELYMEGEAGTGHPSLAVTQKPSSLPSSGQTFYQISAASQPNKHEHSLTSLADPPHPRPSSGSKQEEGISQTSRAKPALKGSGTQKQPMKDLEIATNEEGELAQSSVVPWPLPPRASTASMHSDTKHTNLHTDTNISKINNDVEMTTDSHKSLEMRDDEDRSHSRLNKDTHTAKTDSPQVKSLHLQTHIPDLNQSTKDQQLQEEERFLLAKIQLMAGDTSAVSGPRGMKRLIPNPRDIDCDTAELVDHSQRFLIPCFDTLQEISLTADEEPPANELGQKMEGEEDV
ncbi:axoneme-associated protein mst101(2)-like isoform X2 [Chaetodon trifascialis]|uniref:axoneme-associated protein mst101(2)-like isoform X2 n=1 Tax=Chaetodon trifascialis TaxID=109706 RepID=UPI003992C7FF